MLVWQFLHSHYFTSFFRPITRLLRLLHLISAKTLNIRRSIFFLRAKKKKPCDTASLTLTVHGCQNNVPVLRAGQSAEEDDAEHGVTSGGATEHM